MQTLTLRRWLSSISLLGILSILVVFLSMLFGSSALKSSDVLRVLIGNISGHPISEINSTILFQIRLPRILLAAVVGGSLAAAGGMFQTILRNPLADPYILGTSSGAALGVILSLFTRLEISFLGFTSTTVMAFTGAIVTLYFVYRFSRIHEKTSPQTMLLAGIMVNAIIFAVILFLTSVVNSNQLYRVFFWLLGYLSAPDYTSLITISLFFLVGIGILFSQSRALNILTLGDETAQALGLDVESVKRKVFVAGALLIASAVSICGPIGFLGIMVPHTVRLVAGHDYRVMLPLSVLGGGIFLMIADTVARTVISPAEIPVGVITSLAGGPFFLYLLRKKRMI